MVNTRFIDPMVALGGIEISYTAVAIFTRPETHGPGVDSISCPVG